MLALQRGSASVRLPLLSTLRRTSAYFRTSSESKKSALSIQSRKPAFGRSFKTSSQWQQQAATAAIEQEVLEDFDEPALPARSHVNAAVSNGPVTKFKELSERGLVCQTVVNTITKGMGLETMTQVQSMTINETLKGIDVLAQARTGTGKTLAFLIPILQNIINCDPSLEKKIGQKRAASTDIRAIIISPTRELAEQIAVEAQKVTKDTAVIVQTAVGGTQKSYGLRKIKNEGCHILVGTPGRLNDLLSDPYSQVRAPNLSALVLDEADRLLDQGFATAIQAIQELLPHRRDMDRQTLLYSATVPKEVMQIVRSTMKQDFKFVRTVKEGEQQTHEKVPQRLVHCKGFENQIPALVELSLRELRNPDAKQPFKAIVYFGSTADVALASAILRQLQPRDGHLNPLSGPNASIPESTRLVEMHAKLDQNKRTQAADTFRRATSAIMLSSDVTARGMDFPNVTHVIQLGMPSSEEQYVHRIGRTARGDKAGEGWLMINKLEDQEVHRRFRNMPLKSDNSLETAQVDMTKEGQLPEQTAKILTSVAESTNLVPRLLKVKAYMSSLGQYQWFPNKQALVDAMNHRAQYGWGMSTPPAMGGGLAHKLGLNRIKGINIGHEDYEDSRRSYGRDRSSSRDAPMGGRYEGGGGRADFGSSPRGRGGFNGFDREGSRDGFGGRARPRSFDRDGDREEFGGQRSSYGSRRNDGDAKPAWQSGRANAERGGGRYERAERY